MARLAGMLLAALLVLGCGGSSGVDDGGDPFPGETPPGPEPSPTSSPRNEPPSFEGLGSTLEESQALDVTADGEQVVGWAWRNAKNRFAGQAFRWTRKTGMAAITEIPDDPIPATSARANGISDDGSIIAGTSSIYISFLFEGAFRWTITEGIEALAPAEMKPYPRTAVAISGNGEVIVGHAEDLDGSLRPYRWSLERGLELLSSPGLPRCEASGVSYDGTKIVGSCSEHDETRIQAVEWSGTDPTVLPKTSVDADCAAKAISADGSVAAGRCGSEAVRWDDDGVEILSPHPRELGSAAFSVSADGSMVGGTVYNGIAPLAFLWTRASGKRLLRDLLMDAGLPVEGWWTLDSVVALSADGRVAVGAGLRQGYAIEAFRAVLPP